MDNPDNKNTYKLKKMTENELYDFMAGWKPSHWQYIAGMAELRRRNERLPKIVSLLISLIAIIISFASLLIAIFKSPEPVLVTVEVPQLEQVHTPPSEVHPDLKHQDQSQKSP